MKTPTQKFIQDYFIGEAGAFIAAAGANGLRIYNFIKWKEGMLKKKLGNQYDYWISLGNDEFQKHFGYMQRQTKCSLLKKLAAKGLIELKREPGAAFKVLRKRRINTNGKI